VSKRTLLLADDSVTIQKVVNLTFADEGIEVVTVGDGDSAMQKISELSPDVVLADVHMPGLSGYQICEIVRENPVTRNLPIVLLVGSFEPFDESEAARVGANAYLTKPFQSIRQLVTQVTDLMQAASSEPSQPEPAQTASDVVEQPPPPTAKVPDTTDIDSLYNQSFSGPVTAEAAPPPSVSEGETGSEGSHNAYGDPTYSDAQTDTGVGTPSYVDAGMDDEMIETSHVGGGEETSEAPVSDHVETEYQTPAQSEETYAPTVDSEYTTEPQYSFDLNTPDEQTGYGEPETGWESGDDQPANAGAFDSYAEDRVETAASIEGAADAVAEFDEFSRTEQIPASITSSAFNLDDLEILDLPPLEKGTTQEFTTTRRSDSEGGGKEIVSMSPELMDILVQRVVEKLSKDK
jgi:CheY-like chemotaxis protein